MRDWLRGLPDAEKREIGADIKTVQFGWPIGMPVVDHVEGEIWEVRTRLETRLARVLFVLEGNAMVLMHGFIKKERKTPRASSTSPKEIEEVEESNMTTKAVRKTNPHIGSDFDAFLREEGVYDQAQGLSRSSASSPTSSSATCRRPVSPRPTWQGAWA